MGLNENIYPTRGLALKYAILGSRVRIPVIRWPLFILWYHRRVAKDYPNCCYIVLRRDLQCLYASEAVVAISLARSQHIQERT